MFDLDDLRFKVEMKWEYEKAIFDSTVDKILDSSRVFTPSKKHRRFTEIDLHVLLLLSHSPKNIYELHKAIKKAQVSTRYSSVHHSVNKLHECHVIQAYRHTEKRKNKHGKKAKYYCLSVIGMGIVILNQKSFKNAAVEALNIASKYTKLRIPHSVRLPLCKVQQFKDIDEYSYEVVNLKLIYTFCKVFEMIRKIYSSLKRTRAHKDTYNWLQRWYKHYVEYIKKRKLMRGPCWRLFPARMVCENMNAGKFWKLFCQPIGPFDVENWTEVAVKDPDMTKSLKHYLTNKIKIMKSKLFSYEVCLKKLRGVSH